MIAILLNPFKNKGAKIMISTLWSPFKNRGRAFAFPKTFHWSNCNCTRAIYLIYACTASLTQKRKTACRRLKRDATCVLREDWGDRGTRHSRGDLRLFVAPYCPSPGDTHPHYRCSIRHVSAVDARPLIEWTFRDKWRLGGLLTLFTFKTSCFNWRQLCYYIRMNLHMRGI